MDNKLSVSKYTAALILIFVCLSMVLLFQIGNKSFANPLYSYDTLDLRLSRYWQGLNTPNWADWSVNYYLSLAQSHDKLYEATQSAGNGGYFKSNTIKTRPLIIWFVYNNGSTTKPEVIKSSGNDKYDLFNCSVIEKAKVPEFPENHNRVFVWDGEITEVISYLKNKGVLPVDYQIDNTNLHYQFNWEKI